MTKNVASEVSDLLCAHGLMYKGPKTVDHISAVFANRNTNEITTATMMLVCEHTVGRPYRRESRIHANMQRSRCSKEPPCRVMAVRGYRDESERKSLGWHNQGVVSIWYSGTAVST